MLRQEDHKFSLSYIMRPYLKKKKTGKKKKKGRERKETIQGASFTEPSWDLLVF